MARAKERAVKHTPKFPGEQQVVEQLRAYWRKCMAENAEKADSPSMPSLNEFCLRWMQPPITQRTLQYWAERYPLIDYEVRLLKDLQREYLVQGGLHRRLNSRVVALQLFNNHETDDGKRYSMKHDITSGDKPLSIADIVRRAAKYEQQKDGSKS